MKDLLTQGVAQVNGHFADRDGQNQRARGLHAYQQVVLLSGLQVEGHGGRSACQLRWIGLACAGLLQHLASLGQIQVGPQRAVAEADNPGRALRLARNDGNVQPHGRLVHAQRVARAHRRFEFAQAVQHVLDRELVGGVGLECDGFPGVHLRPVVCEHQRLACLHLAGQCGEHQQAQHHARHAATRTPQAGQYREVAQRGRHG